MPKADPILPLGRCPGQQPAVQRRRCPRRWRRFLRLLLTVLVLALVLTAAAEIAYLDLYP